MFFFQFISTKKPKSSEIVIQERLEETMPCLAGLWLSMAAPCMLERPRVGGVGQFGGVTTSPLIPPPPVSVSPVPGASNQALGLEDRWQPPPTTSTAVPSDTPGRTTL